MGCGSSNNSNIQVCQPKFSIAKDYIEHQGQTCGEGIKTTVAWEATLTPSMLQSKRQEFWDHFPGHNRSSWLYLRQAAEADAATSKLLLEMGGFSLENGTMAVCISPNGHRYELPPFILSDPVKFKDPNAQTIQKKVLHEETISIKLRTVFTVREDVVQVSNSITIKELKDLYVTKNSDLTSSEIRLFFGGKQLQDPKSLMSYFIETGMVILVYKKSQ